MMRSMFTAISALRLHQNFMDTVADNLANANTTGFKNYRFSFMDQYSQLMSYGAAPSDALGGVNPIQIGLGTRLGTITPTMTQGPLQATGRNTDLAIQGEGFFIYAGGGKQLYSRDGLLEMDAEGYIVHGATGMRIQGWQADDAGNLNTGGAIGDIQIPLGDSRALQTANVTLGGNLNASQGLTPPTATYDVTTGVYDSLGAPVPVTLNYARTGASTWTWTVNGVAGSGGPIQFDSNGRVTSPTAPVNVSVVGPNGTVNFAVDMSNLTQLSTTSDVSVQTQDGLAAGTLTSFYVSTENGVVYGLYSNGMQRAIGQVALASFTNPAGLVRDGQNMFQQGLNSGEPSIGATGTGGRGTVASGYLEGSNVDMSQEFTNMILAERGFQASSRVITTSDEMLQELVNLKR